MKAPGRIVILNGVPRAGKTSIARAIQDIGEGDWLNIGVDSQIATLPEQLKPGIGLRPGGERPDLEPKISDLYSALFRNLAAHAGLGFNIVADLGIHEGYSTPLGIWEHCISSLDGFELMLVGVRCCLEEILRRRAASGTGYLAAAPDGSIPDIVNLWDRAVHDGRAYDLEVDTSELSPQECADQILVAVKASVSLFSRQSGPPTV